MKSYIILILALVACDPRTPTATSIDAGEASPVASSSGSGEAGHDGGSPACTTPRIRDIEYRCERHTDCNSLSYCTTFQCVEGGCVYEELPAGSRCDAGAFRGVCQAGACCPVTP